MDAIFSISDDKAPGTDGYNAMFFIRSWCIVGSSALEAVKDFLKSGRLLGEVDCTAVSLIP